MHPLGDKLFVEDGQVYSFGPGHGLMHLSYRAYHCATQTYHDRMLYVENEEALSRLLLHWQLGGQGRWLYYLGSVGKTAA